MRVNHRKAWKVSGVGIAIADKCLLSSELLLFRILFEHSSVLLAPHVLTTPYDSYVFAPQEPSNQAETRVNILS